MTPKPTQRRVEEEVASTKIVGTFARLNVETSGERQDVASGEPKAKAKKAKSRSLAPICEKPQLGSG